MRHRHGVVDQAIQSAAQEPPRRVDRVADLQPRRQVALARDVLLAVLLSLAEEGESVAQFVHVVVQQHDARAARDKTQG